MKVFYSGPLSTVFSLQFIPTMKGSTVLAVILTTYVNFVESLPVESENQNLVRLLDYNQTSGVDGSFHYKYSLSDGQSQFVNGFNKDVNGEKSLAIEGSYTFIDPDGFYNEVKYIADENGFKVTEITRVRTAVGYGGISPKAVASLLGG